MLVLSRRVKEQLIIGEDTVITVQKIAGNRITLSIQAPSEVRIRRGELDQQEATRLRGEKQGNNNKRLAAPAAGSVPADQTHVAIASRPLA